VFPKTSSGATDKQFALLMENPRHPSLQLKPVGEFWSARVTDNYRVLAFREETVFTWFWIGSHDEYVKILKRGLQK
jgi:hypothetical protein